MKRILRIADVYWVFVDELTDCLDEYRLNPRQIYDKQVRNTTLFLVYLVII